MSLWRQLTRGRRTLSGRTAADQDIDDEVQQYFDQAAAAWRAARVDPSITLRAE